MLAARNIGALVVLDDEALIGLVSERDLVRRVMIEQRDPATTTVREVMTVRPITIRPDDTVFHCMGIMTHQRIRHLPVVSGSEVVGMMTLGDAVHTVLREKDMLIEDLETYINGSSPWMPPSAH
jgi:CBS domain-containing protein